MSDSQSWPRELVRLFERGRARYFRNAFRILGDRDDAEDAVLEAFQKAAGSWGSLDGELEPWVAAITRNTALSALRSRKRCPTCELPADVALDSFERSVLSRISTGELMDRLDAGDLKVVQVMDKSDREAAEVLGISIGAYKSRQHRTRKRLRSLLAT